MLGTSEKHCVNLTADLHSNCGFDLLPQWPHLTNSPKNGPCYHTHSDASPCCWACGGRLQCHHRSSVPGWAWWRCTWWGNHMLAASPQTLPPPLHPAHFQTPASLWRTVIGQWLWGGYIHASASATAVRWPFVNISTGAFTSTFPWWLLWYINISGGGGQPYNSITVGELHHRSVFLWKLFLHQQLCSGYIQMSTSLWLCSYVNIPFEAIHRSTPP